MAGDRLDLGRLAARRQRYNRRPAVQPHMFKDATLLVTGGTGTFGNAVVDRVLSSDIREIRIFSRDEKKQDDMRRKYGSAKLKFYLGDVRSPHGLRDAMHGVDYVFHAAALKQ